MNIKLSFWAQGLREADRTVVVDRGEQVAGTDQRTIDTVVERFRLVREKGECVNERLCARAWYRTREFLIRVVPAEKDFRGRDAPVLIGASVPQQLSSAWVDEIAVATEQLMNLYGYSLSLTAKDDLRAVLMAVEKKAQSPSRALLIGLLASGLLLLLAVLLSRER